MIYQTFNETWMKTPPSANKRKVTKVANIRLRIPPIFPVAQLYEPCCNIAELVIMVLIIIKMIMNMIIRMVMIMMLIIRMIMMLTISDLLHVAPSIRCRLQHLEDRVC